jgi:hypothetical protein
MNRWTHKVAQYKFGLEQINELIMLNLVVKEPESLQFNPETDGSLQPGQMTQLDPNDPITYINHAHFPPPLPLDKLVLLNELQQRMSMGLESKAGALRALGEEFPDEKLTEIREELIADAKSDGAINLVKVEIQKQIADMTGMMVSPDGSATPIDPMMMGGEVIGDGDLGPAGQEEPATPEEAMAEMAIFQAGEQIKQALVSDAFAENVPQRTVIDKDDI